MPSIACNSNLLYPSSPKGQDKESRRHRPSFKSCLHRFVKGPQFKRWCELFGLPLASRQIQYLLVERFGQHEECWVKATLRTLLQHTPECNVSQITNDVIFSLQRAQERGCNDLKLPHCSFYFTRLSPTISPDDLPLSQEKGEEILQFLLDITNACNDTLDPLNSFDTHSGALTVDEARIIQGHFAIADMTNGASLYMKQESLLLAESDIPFLGLCGGRNFEARFKRLEETFGVIHREDEREYPRYSKGARTRLDDWLVGIDLAKNCTPEEIERSERLVLRWIIEQMHRDLNKIPLD